MAPQPRQSLSRILPLLLLLSGFCGISYEILYTKLLGNLLGNQFTINATVLLTFLLGIGMGTLYAHRFGRWLWLIEAMIGLYAALAAVAYGIVERLLYAWVPFLSTSMLATTLVSFVLLLAPAFMIGCSIPLFAGYLASIRDTQVFSLTYGIYNIGAALTALAMEFVVVRSVGLRAATLLLASLNVAVALGLLWMIRRHGLRPARPEESVRFPAHLLTALALASVASAVFQLMMIKLAEFVFGPYNETFSLVLATVLLGIAAGSFASGRLGLSFNGALLMALGGLAWLLAALPEVFRIYASMYRDVVDDYALLVLLKLGVVIVLMGLPAVGFGATIPALLRSHRDVARESGQLLFCSSVANALGFLLMAFVLHRFFDYGPLILVVGALTVLALVVRNLPFDGQRSPRLGAAAAAGLLFLVAWGAFRIAWEEDLLYAGHTNLHALMQPRSGEVFPGKRFKGAQDVFAITYQRGKPYFFINGYISIPLSNASEKIVGALSSMLSPRLDRALVLGVGSGATAGTVGLLFDRTDAVEINRVVLNNLDLMAEYSFDIQNQPNTDIVHDDGIHFLRTSREQYSLILNTVTTPLYFSSSKLYTRDLFELVVDRLTPDGVYMTWVDVEIGDVGIDIILDSLATSFERCWLMVIKDDYFLLGCSNADLALHNHDAVVTHPTLQAYFATEHSFPVRLLPYNIISTDAFELGGGDGTAINTLDFPILEFEMARRQSDRLHAFKRRLRRRLDLKLLKTALEPAMAWVPAEFTVNADVRLPRRTELFRILDGQNRADFALSFERIDETVLRLAEEVDTAAAYQAFGVMLIRRGRDAAAAHAFGRAAALDPGLDEIDLDLGRAYLGAEDFERAEGHLMREWEKTRSAEVPLRMAKTLIGLERHEEALGWIDITVAVGNESPERIHYYRGMTHERLHDTEQALAQYDLALRADPESTRSQEALVRLRSHTDPVTPGR